MKTKTYNLPMKGLKKASGATVNWTRGGHTQISYDLATGEIFTNDHIGESWSQYHDPDVITICHTSRHMTMQQIADAIYETLTERTAEAVGLLSNGN